MQRLRLWTAICFAAFVATGIAVNLLGSTFANLSLRYGFPLEDAGIFTALQAIGSTTAVLIFGWLLDRRDPRWVLCGATLLFGGGVLLLGFAPVLPLALAGSLLMGIGFGGMLAGPNYVIASLYAARSASALNALNVFYSLGAMISPQIVAFALRQDDFRIAYLVAGVLILALVLPFATIQLQNHKHQTAQNTPSSVNYLALIPFILLFFTYIGSEVGFGAWIFTQLSTVAQAVPETAALATSVYWAGQMVGRIAGTIILRRIADEALLPLTIGLIGIGVAVLLAFQTQANLSIIAAFIVGFGCGPVFPTTLGIVRKAYPTSHGTASGILIGLGNIGAIVLPWLQGQIGGGKSGGMQLILVASLIMLLTAILIQRRLKNQTAAAIPAQS
ncbi:MAG: MFS transporter [Anaerolineae bacterium]|nr:MFS transporter [Anaerolineae bacterium]